MLFGDPAHQPRHSPTEQDSGERGREEEMGEPELPASWVPSAERHFVGIIHGCYRMNDVTG